MSRTLTDKICLIACITLICLVSSVTISATLTTKQVIGSDFYFHKDIATFIAQGDFNGAWNYTIVNNRFPYALFAFHTLVLAPTILTGNPMPLNQMLQALFLPLTFSLCIWLMLKFANPKAAMITGLMLLGCWSFTDGALQVRPESLDLLFYPIIVFALLAAKKKTFTALSALTIYSHGPAALGNIYGLAASKLRDKTWRKTIILAVIIILPVLLLSVAFIGGALDKWGGMPRNENPQEYDFWHNPVFIPYYMGATIFAVPFLFQRNKTPLQKILLWGIIGSLIIMPLWADRWLHYISIPLACIAGAGITRLSASKQILFITAITLFAIMYYVNFISISYYNLWWQPGN